ncbi:zona pellucida sperm-binding protein 3-like [Pseudochaenichthys georgianus]|uniref:zona pellucida sperm-binding protein 3-like n=1 Tax=Pseudochaenichthys georgianus TaxID=52239 RepID=UPI00146F7801|nr:zona pellucida sperm-binding protein 3-like [Pseudochaenichthys georgianus]
MVMKSTVVCIVALALLGSLCHAQIAMDGYKPAAPHQKPATRQEPVKQQSKQKFERPLTWVYPEDPKPEPEVEVPFELRLPVAFATVDVECRESIVHVEAKKDFFGNGQFINPADITLGNCAPVAEDNAARVLIFETELHSCHSTLTVTEKYLIYSFTLNHDPKPLADTLVVRTGTAAVIVECHYPRKHNVSSLPLDPLWIPFSAVKVSEEFLYFTLRLMTDDWQNERPSFQYYLGDIINVEAVVKQFFHVPLRVYVERCVATIVPDMNSLPCYVFIENNGCLVDARITGSSSKFMHRTAENKLQFQLEAFRFKNVDSGMLYISCHLKATSTLYPIDTEHRACSYNNGWKEASGQDAQCGSCEAVGFGGTGGNQGTVGHAFKFSQAPGRKIRDVSQNDNNVSEWEGDVTLGPIPIGERVVA